MPFPIPPLPLPNVDCLRDITGLDGRHYIIDLARAFPPESPRGVPHLSTQEYSIGQKVFATYKSKSKTTGSFQLATIVFVHDPTNPNPYVLQGERMYDVIFQVDKSLAFKVPQSKIRNGQQSIFWRLLRPEFVKHRGRSLIEKYSTDSKIHETSEGAVTYSGFEVRGPSGRNIDPLEGSVLHSIDASKIPSSATASAHISQSMQEEGSSKNYGQFREVRKIEGAQISCIERHEIPQHQQQQHYQQQQQQQQQQHQHHSHIKEQQAPSSSSCLPQSSSGAADTGYVSSYTAAEQLFEYQATPQSMNICDTRNQNSTYDSLYSAADEICSGASLRSEETNSGYKTNSYSSSSEEYSHHYRNIYHNRNYFNYDNYMLHASSGGDSSICNRNIDDERGGIGDESCSSDGINQQLERMTQMHMGSPHVLDAIGAGSCITDSMGRPVTSRISHLLGATLTAHPLCSSSTPSSRRLPSPSTSAPQGAYHTVKTECRNVAPEYSPSYVAAEQLFGYQATAPESATPLAQTASALTDDKLLLNGIRNGLVRSRSEDRSTYSQVTASSSIIRALEGASNGPISDTNSSHDNNNNKTDEETSVMTRMHDTPTLIRSVGASEEPWQRRGRSGSLDTASARARKRTQARLLSVSNIAMKALEGEGESSKEQKADALVISGGVETILSSATSGLLIVCKGDDRDTLHHRTVDIGSQSSVMPSEDMTRSAASKDPPPLSADSLSAFSGAHMIV